MSETGPVKPARRAASTLRTPASDEPTTTRRSVLGTDDVSLQFVVAQPARVLLHAGRDVVLRRDAELLPRPADVHVAVGVLAGARVPQFVWQDRAGRGRIDGREQLVCRNRSAA